MAERPELEKYIINPDSIPEESLTGV